jgi:hypothetical protein
MYQESSEGFDVQGLTWLASEMLCVCREPSPSAAPPKESFEKALLQFVGKQADSKVRGASILGTMCC